MRLFANHCKKWAFKCTLFIYNIHKINITYTTHTYHTIYFITRAGRTKQKKTKKFPSSYAYTKNQEQQQPKNILTIHKTKKCPFILLNEKHFIWCIMFHTCKVHMRQFISHRGSPFDFVTPGIWSNALRPLRKRKFQTESFPGNFLFSVYHLFTENRWDIQFRINLRRKPLRDLVSSVTCKR